MKRLSALFIAALWPLAAAAAAQSPGAPPGTAPLEGASPCAMGEDAACLDGLALAVEAAGERARPQLWRAFLRMLEPARADVPVWTTRAGQGVPEDWGGDYFLDQGREALDRLGPDGLADAARTRTDVFASGSAPDILGALVLELGESADGNALLDALRALPAESGSEAAARADRLAEIATRRCDRALFDEAMDAVDRTDPGFKGMRGGGRPEGARETARFALWGARIDGPAAAPRVARLIEGLPGGDTQALSRAIQGYRAIHVHGYCPAPAGSRADAEADEFAPFLPVTGWVRERLEETARYFPR